MPRSLCGLILAMTMAGPCFALDVLDQLWPEVDVFVKTSQDTRLFFMGSGTRIRQGGYSDGQWASISICISAPSSSISPS